MSTIKVGTIEKASGDPVNLTKQDGVKAWTNINGVGAPTSRDSLNISSLTDNGTGDYTIGFTNNMADGNFCSPVTNHNLNAVGTVSARTTGVVSAAASSFRCTTGYPSNTAGAGTVYDDDYTQICVLGDLA